MSNETCDYIYNVLKRCSLEELQEAQKYCEEELKPSNPTISVVALRETIKAMIEAKESMIVYEEINKIGHRLF